MATSVVDVCNAALSKLGQDIAIASLSEQSKAARAFNRAYERVRDYVLADFVWPFAVKSVALAPDAQTALGWQFRYAYPDDCLNALSVCTEAGVRVATSAVCNGYDGQASALDGSYDFDVVHGEQSTGIVTDLEAAYLIYSSRVEDIGRYSPHFIEALSCRLALDVAPVIALEVGIKMGNLLEQKYLAAKSRAAVQAFNESRDTVQPVTPSIAARGG